MLHVQTIHRDPPPFGPLPDQWYIDAGLWRPTYERYGTIFVHHEDIDAIEKAWDDQWGGNRPWIATSEMRVTGQFVPTRLESRPLPPPGDEACAVLKVGGEIIGTVSGSSEEVSAAVEWWSLRYKGDKSARISQSLPPVEARDRSYLLFDEEP